MEGKRVWIIRRIVAGILVAVLVLGCGCAWAAPQGKDDGYKFSINCANYETNKIAITIDDCFDLDKVAAAVELCNKYGVKVTFFPLGQMIRPEDRALWQSVVDAGCEIGSHNYFHEQIYQLDAVCLQRHVCKVQEALDAALGYHYTIRNFRPPFGKIKESDGKDTSTRVVRGLRKVGYQHVILWNVSQTDPKLAMKKVKGGCIMLYHARNKDIKCLETIIPQLLEQGYELVTVCELLGFDPPEIGGEPYVYDPKDYE